MKRIAGTEPAGMGPWGAGVIRRLAATLILLLGFAAPAWAQAKPAPTTMVQDMTNQVLKVLETNEGKPVTPAIKGQVADIVLPHIDFVTMSRYVMAQYWRQMTPAQQDRFVHLFKDLLVRTYTTSLSHYNGQTVRITGSREIPGTPVAEVNMVIHQRGGPDVPVIYALVWNGQEWRIYNVFIDGVSLVLNYRNSYGQLVAQRGVDGLLKEMAQKVEEPVSQS